MICFPFTTNVCSHICSFTDGCPMAYVSRHQCTSKYVQFNDFLLAEASVFVNREFSFTLQDDIYIRYQSFDNQSELEKEICLKSPFKIDIGAVYNVRPKDHRASTMIKPVQRELVFDIDMTDYDEIRTCCNEANVCPKCWKFMTIACKIIDAALREDFGFEHLLWVFSGRRGIHCWVCDKTARYLDTKGRSAVAEYLHILISAGEGSVTRVNLGDRMHHAIKRAHNIIEPYFEEVCIVDQNMFATPEGLRKLLGMVQDEGVRVELDKELKPHEGNSKAIWKAFEGFFEALRVSGQPKARKFKYIIEETQLAFTYPRIDINVSKGFNHLLKSPFCVHPKTGKVCIPFNPNVADKFDPTQVPTIRYVLR